jgi:hypothetical protein
MSKSITLDKHEMVIDIIDYENLKASNDELLEALKDAKRQLEIATEKIPLNQLWVSLPATVSICAQAIVKAEGRS